MKIQNQVYGIRIRVHEPEKVHKVGINQPDQLSLYDLVGPDKPELKGELDSIVGYDELGRLVEVTVLPPRTIDVIA